jgi:Holliday junction resolvase-like predicted endonuclease
MAGMDGVSSSEFAAATARSTDDTGTVEPSALTAELLIENNRQLGAVNAERLVDDLVELQLPEEQLGQVIDQLHQRLPPADLPRVVEALDSRDVNESTLTWVGERMADGVVGTVTAAGSGLSALDRQISDSMANANRYLAARQADPNAPAWVGAASDVVTGAQLTYGGIKGVGTGALGLLGDTVDLGKMAWNLTTDPAYRDAIVGAAKAYAAEAAADPGQAVDDVVAAGQDALAQWEAGLEEARAQGREAEYLGNTGGAVGVELVAALVPISKIAKFGKIGRLLENLTPDNLGALVRELGDFTRLLDAGGDAAPGAAQALRGVVGLVRNQGELEALVTAARASGNMDGLLKAGAFQPEELTELLRTQPDVFSGRTGFDDALAASTSGVDLSTASANTVGAIGEALATRELVRQGYTDIVSVQNKSGHGIDLVARNSEGGLEFFEVKASGIGRAAPPVAGSEAFVTSRLERALSDTGQWAEHRMPEGMRELARDLSDELAGSTPVAKWVQVNLARQPGTHLLDLSATQPTVSPWPQ